MVNLSVGRYAFHTRTSIAQTLYFFWQLLPFLTFEEISF